MATSEMQKQEKSRSRFLIIAAAVMLLLACGVFGSLFYLQRQSATSGEAAIEDRYAAEKAALEPTKEVAEERVARLEALRTKWRPWALKHQKELKGMLKGDRVAWMAAYDAVPTMPKKEDAGFSGEELNSPVQGMSFSWQPGAKLYKLYPSPKKDAKSEKEDNESQKATAKILEKNFAALRDIELSRSVNTGRTHVTFWASGRITRGTWIDNPNTSAGQPSLIEAPDEEIQPPYDFL